MGNFSNDLPTRLSGQKGNDNAGSEDPNTLRSKSLGRLLDLLSEGPIKGLVDDKKGIYFNDTAWQAQTGEMNFEGIRAEFRYGDMTQVPIAGFPSIEREVSVGVQIKNPTSVTRTISDPLLHAVRATVSVSGLVRSEDDGNIHGTSVQLAIDVKVFGGSFVEVVLDTISGKTNSVYERSYRIELPQGGAPWDIRIRRITDDSVDIKLQNDTYWSRYTEIIDHQLIYPDSAYVGVQFDAQLFKDGIPQRRYLVDGIKMSVPSNYFPLGMPIENLAPYSEDLTQAVWTQNAVNAISSATLTMAPDGNLTAYGLIPTVTSTIHYVSRVTTGLSAGSTYSHSVYVKLASASMRDVNLMFYDNANNAKSISLTLNLTTEVLTTVISASALADAGVLTDYGFEKLSNGWYRIYMVGSTGAATTSYLARFNLTNSAGLTTFAGNGLTNYAWVWGYHLSRSSGAHPYLKSVATATTGLSNQRFYFGSWDGLFKSEWCNNPAWVKYMLLTNTRFGLGQWVPATLVDKWQLYTLAKYCDELVPDGFGDMEPRFTFNGVLKEREEAFKVLQTIAAVFRGMMYWGAGSTLISYDAPKDASILVTPANVIDGNFDYQGVGWKARHSVALVSWNDPNNLYSANVEAIEDQDLIERFGWKPLETLAIGCTSRGQAVRWGKWILDTEKNETETVTYRASFDHMIKDGTAVMPGDIVNIQDPSYAGVRSGGRIMEVFPPNANTEYGFTTAATLILDQVIDWDIGETYTISVVTSGGVVVDRPVTQFLGSANGVLLGGSILTDYPIVNAMWVITSSVVAPRPFRVLAVKEVEPNIVEISALFHDVTKYARVEEDIILETANFSVIDIGPLKTPRNLMYREYLFKTVGGSIGSAVTISWEAPSNEARVTAYEVHMKAPGEDWKYYSTAYEQSIDVPNIKNNFYSFRVRAISAIGSPSQWATLTDINLFGTTLRPSNITSLSMNAIGAQAYLNWTAPNDLTISHYVLKQQNVVTGASWSTGIVVIDKIPFSVNSVFVPLLFGTYMLKSVSVAGIEADVSVNIISDIAGILNFNAVQTIVAEPTWLGTKTSCEINSTNLRTTAISAGVYPAAATYELQGYYDLTEIYTNRITPSITAFGSRPSYTMSQWGFLSSLEFIDGGVDNAWGIVVEYATTKDNPAGAPVWSAWKQLIIGDSTARAYKFRVRFISYDASVQVVMSALKIIIDMPDRVEGQQSLSVLAGGTSVVYPKGFKAVPALASTVQNATAGDDVVITAETRLGFTIQVKNAGAGVARTVNWIAKGYGKVS